MTKRNLVISKTPAGGVTVAFFLTQSKILMVRRRASAVSNHVARIVASSSETPRTRLLRMRDKLLMARKE
jgi:hypothetical protein